MEGITHENLTETLYRAESFTDFMASLALPWPVGFFDHALDPVFLPDALNGFSLMESAEESQKLSAIADDLCVLDLSKNGCYAGTLVFAAPVAAVYGYAPALAEATLLALDLFGLTADVTDTQMDVWLETVTDPSEEYTCLYCETDAANRTAGRLIREFGEAADLRFSCRCGNGIALLFAGDVRTSGEILSIINNMGCRVGFSGPFASPVLAVGCAQKAMRAAGFSKPAEPLTSFRKVRWESLCREAESVLNAQGYRAEDFLHDGLVRLLACDAENDTGYFDTLYAYLSCGKSLRTAAEKLSLHRNTLDYRIRRIRELFALDLEDQNTCFELLFSCRLYLSLVKGGSR
ncbi:MAG: helix-turn-helix domain-containing protein [Clostridia bacterium]|nr:helix-turn-helix domain-containing protein [Clostridia bacterium]